MQKPITIAHNDYVNTIVNATNQSGLPAFVMIPVLKDVIRELEQIAQNDLAHDLQLYRQSIEQKNMNDDTQQTADIPAETE